MITTLMQKQAYVPLGLALGNNILPTEILMAVSQMDLKSKKKATKRLCIHVTAFLCILLSLVRLDAKRQLKWGTKKSATEIANVWEGERVGKFMWFLKQKVSPQSVSFLE